MFQMLRCLCRNYTVIPPTYTMRPGSLSKIGEHPLEHGGYADVWRGELKTPTGRVKVALKVIRINAKCASRIRPNVCHEVVMWRRLRHRRITPMFGVDETLFPLCIVSKWQEHGTISAFLKQFPAENRLRLLIDVCEGLQYLHSQTFAHGDLKCSNILVDSTRHACLCDFGLTALIHGVNTVDPTTQSNGGQGTIQYMAPELLYPEAFGLQHAHVSLEADIYALAIVMWEIFAGRPPYSSWGSGQIHWRILRGKRPPHLPDALPLGLSDSVWKLMEECWQSDRCQRPQIRHVLSVLADAVKTSHHAVVRHSRATAHGAGRPSELCHHVLVCLPPYDTYVHKAI
ncbi:kinase-like domain-containing protein [Rhodofomes roseus]|uniref:Kinase-like domain-containing protein n=1 Tax=Rhodofomes roseus TaxID=34475 RepID=A0ABQ8KQ88_9APHY|nr:kinase-like domain-containing protein [Rhodofomes roseus]KAH9840784.1 kinase-like domain-containing protein [Rhodofomes roseus]